MKRQHHAHILFGALLGLALVAASGLRAQGPISPPASGQSRNAGGWPDEFRGLESQPNSQFNRVHELMRQYRERIRPILEEVDRHTQNLAEMRARAGDTGALQGVREAREEVAALHRAMLALEQETEHMKDVADTEIVPHLSQMRTEVQTEISRLNPEDPRTRMLVGFDSLLAGLEANPSLVDSFFERGPMLPGPGQRFPGPRDDTAASDSSRVLQHIERLEGQQRWLLRWAERLDAEIESLRATVSAMSSEEMQALDESLPDSFDQRSMRWNRFSHRSRDNDEDNTQTGPLRPPDGTDWRQGPPPREAGPQ